jgi:hypothetical protein
MLEGMMDIGYADRMASLFIRSAHTQKPLFLSIYNKTHTSFFVHPIIPSPTQNKSSLISVTDRENAQILLAKIIQKESFLRERKGNCTSCQGQEGGGEEEEEG